VLHVSVDVWVHVVLDGWQRLDGTAATRPLTCPNTFRAPPH